MTVVASRWKREANDAYETPAWVTEVLLRHVDVAGRMVWEPAAGNHGIADVLCQHGAVVTTSDLVTYSRPHDYVGDFMTLAVDAAPADLMILTNPPYGPGNRTAVRWAEVALRRAGTVALLLTAKFDSGKTRQHLFGKCPRFWGKIVLLDRPRWFPDGDYASGTEDYAWHIWGPDPTSHPRIVYEGKAP